MIARTWMGRTRLDASEDYLAYLEETGVRDCLLTPGSLGVMVLRSVDDDEARFLFVSFWDSMEVIRGFAGDDPKRARYYDQDREYLLDLPPTVDHFEVALHRESKGGGKS